MAWECHLENAGKTLGMEGTLSFWSPLKGQYTQYLATKKRQVYMGLIIKGPPIPRVSRWWFQIFSIFTLTWGNDPIWLIFFQTGWNHQLGFPTIFSMIMACKLRDFSRTPQGLHQRNHHHREFGAFRDRNRMVSSGTTRIQCTLDWNGQGQSPSGGFLKRGTQQPLFFLLKMIILGCFGGTTI